MSFTFCSLYHKHKNEIVTNAEYLYPSTVLSTFLMLTLATTIATLSHIPRTILQSVSFIFLPRQSVLHLPVSSCPSLSLERCPSRVLLALHLHSSATFSVRSSLLAHPPPACPDVSLALWILLCTCHSLAQRHLQRRKSIVTTTISWAHTRQCLFYSLTASLASRYTLYSPFISVSSRGGWGSGRRGDLARPRRDRREGRSWLC